MTSMSANESRKQQSREPYCLEYNKHIRIWAKEPCAECNKYNFHMNKGKSSDFLK